jgi:PPOX class probable F420-dependent enzyme
MLSYDPNTKFGQRLAKQLSDEHVIWLTTVSPLGIPQTSPVWFWWDGQTFLIYSQPDTPKVRNIEQQPTVTLHFNSDFDGHEITIYTATAVIDPNAPAAKQHTEYLNKYKEGIKTINMTPDQFAQVYATPIRITPTKLRGY